MAKKRLLKTMKRGMRNGLFNPFFNVGHGESELVRSYNFTEAVNTLAVTNTPAGYAQKVDNSFSSFTTTQLRRTDRGVVIEPERTNWVKASSDFPNALWPKGATFTTTSARTSIIPGQTAQEYESDTSAYLINQIGITGNFTAGVETFSLWVEKLPSSNIIRFSVSLNGANTEAEARFNLSTLTLAVSLSGVGTSKTFGYVNCGTGPNGGTLLLLVMSFIPNQVGTQRKFVIYPNDSTALSAGRRVILHHCQHEVGAFATTPIVNTASTANTRAVDSVKASIPTGTYDVRYVTYDGTIIDRLSISSVSNELDIATDITERPIPFPASLSTSPNQIYKRGASIASVKIFSHTDTNIHAIGDSYVDSTSGYSLITYLPLKYSRPRTWTFDGVGGSTLTQQAVRFDSTSQYYDDVLIIIDGAINSNTFSLAKAAIDSMVAHLTAPKKWLYIQPVPDATAGNELGGSTYTAWLRCQNELKAEYPSNYVTTLDFLQSLSDGSASDLLDISKGWVPGSKRADNVHLTDSGYQSLATHIGKAIQSKNY